MHSRRFLPVLLLLFIGSGCAALIYEVVWFQLLQLVIGSSAISLAVLLGTFMGGLCLGSLGYSRASPPPAVTRSACTRCSRPAIGVIGLLVLVAHARRRQRLLELGGSRHARHRAAGRGGRRSACSRRRS